MWLTYDVFCGAGIAVIADMALTTHFLSLLMIVCWRKHLIYPIVFYGIFAAIELTYLSSALRKVGDLPPAPASSMTDSDFHATAASEDLASPASTDTTSLVSARPQPKL